MGRLSRRAFALAALATLATAPDAGAVPGRRRAITGMRGVWLATVANRDWPSRPGMTAAEQRRELISHLDVAVRNRLNTVIFQVRPTADALWPSPYEPWSEYLTGTQGKDPGWNPLETAVEEAHARGLELHAWFNPYRIAVHTDLTKLVASHPARRHPDWVVAYGGKLYYNPGLPEVRAFVQRAILDAVKKYPVDAVHFDDYFYPYPVAGQTFDDDEAYARHGAGFPDRAAWRRDNIDKLVRETAACIRRTRPGTRFGISPFGVWRNAATDPLGSDTRAGVQTYDDLHADTRKWVRKNWIDYVAPQIYWNLGFAAADYAKLLPWWAEVARGTGTRLYVGEALYKAGDPAQPAAWQDPAELSRHLTLAEEHPQVRGHVFFAAKDVAADRIGAMARVVADHYRQPARPPR
ncbi:MULTISPECIES: glycoside hydrolase family 10 protein [unclassified Streptomyces]|uniref:glycoside hydrolase family 10 protein n=1 Tax=unclassified Streptomyces TaxID=2593676 RepID=UPI00225C36D9|nr:MULTISPECIES: family 10 glycosylhydrolase [unclassified Streptomyces]MCX5058402.1 family 10 glycosylhydrolase [Streptomyces sp. NBC_00452]MCX5289550.1 family 10 glycosylhydrolase [Streptomyces sp. NBC_00183]